MATNKVNLGIGMATGMFYIAPAGTALPTSPLDTLAAEWELAGAVSADGIEWTPNKDSEPLRNWAKIVERLVAGDEGGTVGASLMYTTEDTLKVIFGDDNVTVTPATATHGKLISVTVEPGVSASPKAFLFLMKDGDDTIMLGTENGILRDVDAVTFAPTEAINWNTTIEAAAWTLVKDDGQLA